MFLVHGETVRKHLENVHIVRMKEIESQYQLNLLKENNKYELDRLKENNRDVEKRIQLKIDMEDHKEKNKRELILIKRKFDVLV